MSPRWMSLAGRNFLHEHGCPKMMMTAVKYSRQAKLWPTHSHLFQRSSFGGNLCKNLGAGGYSFYSR